MKQFLPILIVLALLYNSVAAQSGNALNFNGVNNYVSAPNSSSINLSGSYTIECWFRADQFNFLGGLVGKYQNSNSNGFDLRFCGTAPYTGLNFNGYETPTGILQAGRWYNVAAVSNNGTLTLYLNGVAQTLTGSGYTAVANTDSLTIGADYLTSPRFFDGDIDDVSLWNTALTQSQIQANMGGPINPSATGLAAYYNFNEGVAYGNNTGITTLPDATTNNNTGYLRNFSLTGNTSNFIAVPTPTPGNALNFDGVDDYLKVSNSPSINLTSNYTIECWFMPQSFTGLAGLVGKYQTPNSNGYTLRLAGDGTGNGLEFNGDETPLGILQAGHWYHVAAVSNNGVLSLYLDGVQQTLTHSSDSYTVASTTDSLTIGVDYLTAPRFFNGDIDEVTIFNYAETQTQVQEDMLNAVSPSATGLVAYYNFNAGTAAGNNTSITTMADLSSGTNTAYLNNFALTGTTSNFVTSLAFSLPVANPATNVQVKSFTANWAAGTEYYPVDHYLLDISTGPSFVTFLPGCYEINTGSATSFKITGLEAGITYYYRVSAVIAGVGATAYSSVQPVTTTSGTQILYVDQTAPVGGDGTTWAKAKNQLSDALYTASLQPAVNIIYVAAGTYYPTSDANRDSSFVINTSDFHLYGGYQPGGSGNRNVAQYPTYLDGDIGTKGDSTDNSYNVLRVKPFDSSTTIPTSVIIDGFTIQHGNANGVITQGGGMLFTRDAVAQSAVIISNCTFTANNAQTGGGLFLAGWLQLSNCSFTANTSSGAGGALYILNATGDTTFIDSCSFKNNTADSAGAVYITSSLVKFAADSFCVNQTTVSNGNGGALYVSNATGGTTNNVYLTQSVFKGNRAPSGGGGALYISQPVGVTALIDSCTFKNNSADSAGAVYAFNSAISFLTDSFCVNKTTVSNGGALMLISNAAGTPSTNTSFSQCIFHGDTAASGNGGALYICQPTGTAVIVDSSSFKNNMANNAGAVYVRTGQINFAVDSFYINTAASAAGALYISNATVDTSFISNCSFTGNSADSAGAVLVFNSLVKFSVDSFTVNYTTLTNGGAVIVSADGTVNPSNTAYLFNCLFYNNQAANAGGGMYVNALSAAPSVINSVFQANTAITGGGFMANNSGAGVYNNIFYANKATSGAGAAASAGSADIVNNDFYADTSSQSAGALYFQGTGGALQLYNNIFYKNYAVTGNDLVNANTGGDVDSAHNSPSTVNPVFVNENNLKGSDSIWGTPDDGLHLTVRSSQIDAGDDTKLPSYITTDITGANRVMASNVDEGAYEGAYPTTVVYVDSSVAVSGTGASWQSPIKTITYALPFAVSNPLTDSILIAGGTYYATDTLNINRAGVKIYGGYQPGGSGNRNVALYPTYLDGNVGLPAYNAQNILLITAAPTITDSIVLDGLFFRNSHNAFNNLNGYPGSAIYADGGSSSAQAVLRNCTFSNNYNAYTGAVINGTVYTRMDMLIDNCTFSGNTGGLGGPVCSNTQSITIQNSVFTNNSSTARGAGVYLSGSQASVLNCTFNHNTTGQFGSAILSLVSNLAVKYCAFNNNTGTSGGALYASLGTNANAVVDSCSFSNNTASANSGALESNGNQAFFTLSHSVFQNNSGPAGGAVQIRGNATILSNTFYHNTTTSGGGAVNAIEIAGNYDTLINNLFIGNRDKSTAQGGGALFINAGSNFVTNNTFYADTTAGSGGSIMFTGSAGLLNLYNNIFYNSVSASNTDVQSSATSSVIDSSSNSYSTTNPMFVNEANLVGTDGIWGTADDGLELQNGSPAVGTGDNKRVPADITTDITGAARIQAVTVDEGAYESAFIGPEVWTGAVSTDWATASNWNVNAVPAAGSNVLIPSDGVTYRPVVNSIAQANNITIQTGQLLTLNDTLEIGGSVESNAGINAANGSLEFNGAGAQFLPESMLLNNAVKNLIINTPNYVAAGAEIDITGVFNVESGMFINNGYTVLKSTASGTASVAPISGTASVTGNFTVQRYIPAHRAWRFLTAPVSNSTTIFNNWQNAGDATDSTGAEIWSPNGTGSSGNGMLQGGVAPSIEAFNPIANAWVGLTNTNILNLDTTTISAANSAFGVFVTGPYGSGRITPAQGEAPTTLVATGQLQTGTQVFKYNSIPAGNYILVGNPYASPVDFKNVGATGASIGNINNIMWAWDAQRSGTSYGGYVTFSWDATTNSYDQDIDPAQTAQTDTIQSGEAIFVQADTVNHSNGTPEDVDVIFSESDKAIGKSTNQVFGVTLPVSQLRIALNRQQGSGMQPVDGVLVKYNNSYKASVSDDANKLYNYDENLALRIDTSYLAIERRPAPALNDTLFLDIYALKKNTNYSFTINPSNITLGEGIQPYLVDKFLNTITPVSFDAVNTESFSTTNAAGSYSETRFMIVFNSATALASTITNVKAWLKDKGIQVEWGVATEQGIKQYIVEKSADGVTFSATNTTAAINNNQTQNYDWFDANPYDGNNYYRILVVNKDGSSYYSNVVMVNLKLAVVFKAYPNPLPRNEQLRVEIGGMPAGKYTLQIFSTDGKQVMQKILMSDGNPSTQLLNLQTLPAGVYELILVDEHGNTWKQELVIN